MHRKTQRKNYTKFTYIFYYSLRALNFTLLAGRQNLTQAAHTKHTVDQAGSTLTWTSTHVQLTITHRSSYYSDSSLHLCLEDDWQERIRPSRFSSTSRSKFPDAPRLGPDLFLPYPFQFILLLNAKQFQHWLRRTTNHLNQQSIQCLYNFARCSWCLNIKRNQNL